MNRGRGSGTGATRRPLDEWNSRLLPSEAGVVETGNQFEANDEFSLHRPKWWRAVGVVALVLVAGGLIAEVASLHQRLDNREADLASVSGAVDESVVDDPPKVVSLLEEAVVNAQARIRELEREVDALQREAQFGSSSGASQDVSALTWRINRLEVDLSNLRSCVRSSQQSSGRYC